MCFDTNLLYLDSVETSIKAIKASKVYSKKYKMRAIILSLLVLFTIQTTASLSSAQQDSIIVNTDSINSVILKDLNIKLAEIERQRMDDSIKKAELENQLLTLKITDRYKKEELENQIRELNNKENSRIQKKKAQIDSLRHTAKGFPVKGFFSDTLFFIYGKSGSFSAQERADAISKRIKKINSSFRNKTVNLDLVDLETTIDIVAGETIIMSISENDALWENTTKDELAKLNKEIITKAVIEYRTEISFGSLAKEVLLALLVIIITFFLIKYVSKLFTWITSKILAQEDIGIKGLKIKTYTLFDAKQLVKVILNVINILKWVVILFIIYIALPILFGIFPWTKNFAETLFGYVLNPLGKITTAVWNYLPNLFTIIVIALLFRYVLKFIKFIKQEIALGYLSIPGFYPDWANPTYQIIRVLVIAFMIIVIFPYLPGSDSPIFQGVSVFLGFLFTFGSAGSLSNVIAGLVLTYMRLFKIGDRVKIGDVAGDVIEKSLLVTRVRTIKNEIISIPNSTVMNSHTINYSSDAPEKGLIIHTTVTIGYDVPWREMQLALIEAANRTELILPQPLPFVLQTSLDDFYVSYQINAYIREANKQALIYSNLHQNIQDVCNERGIEILSPHYRAARDGNMVTIPASYLSKDYKTPGFNVHIKND